MLVPVPLPRFHLHSCWATSGPVHFGGPIDGRCNLWNVLAGTSAINAVVRDTAYGLFATLTLVATSTPPGMGGGDAPPS